VLRKFTSINPYNYAENKPINNVDLWGLQAENFMSTFKKPGELKVKSPIISNSQFQHYSTTVKNSIKNYDEITSIFSERPQEILSNSKAEFKRPIDAEGNESSFSEGNFMKINILGPMNNSMIKINKIEQTKSTFSTTFQTMEGHIEKGVIKFVFSQNKDGTLSLTINSLSEVDMGLAPEKFSRNQQSKSWIEVLNNFIELTKGTETNRIVFFHDFNRKN
jgi:hypothetical protein